MKRKLARIALLHGLLFCCALAGPTTAKPTGLIFVSNEKSHTLSVLDPESLQVVKTIETSRRPRDMNFSPDQRLLYVACGDDDVIDVIDVKRLEVVDQIGTGPSPEAFALSPDGTQVWVSNENNATVGYLDLTTGSMIHELATGPEPEGVTLSPEGNTLYVTSEVADMVHVIDLADRSITDSILIGTRPRRTVVSPDGSELWASAELSGEVYIIDRSTNAIDEVIAFLPPGMRVSDVTPVGMAIAPDGKTIVVTLGNANHLAFVNIASREVEDYLLVGSRPWEAAFSKDGSLLFVANGLSDDVSVIDPVKRRVVKSVPVGQIPYGVLIDD